MNNQIIIGSKTVCPWTVWVHLQDANTASCLSYCMEVRRADLSAIFDPHETKHFDVSWASFIKREIYELGTFIIEGYLKNIRTYYTNNDDYYEWVIVSVDDILEFEDRVELRGKVRRFQNL